jgi:hypothetical protein
MRIASLIDVDAMWHVVLYSAVAAVGLATAYGTAVLALDRIERTETGPGERAVWMLTVGLSGAVCLALVAIGFWAITQK